MPQRDDPLSGGAAPTPNAPTPTRECCLYAAKFVSGPCRLPLHHIGPHITAAGQTFYNAREAAPSAFVAPDAASVRGVPPAPTPTADAVLRLNSLLRAAADDLLLGGNPLANRIWRKRRNVTKSEAEILARLIGAAVEAHYFAEADHG